MKLGNDMNNLSLEILSSFKQRVKENEELVSNVQKTLEEFRKGHQEMVQVLSNNALALKKKIADGEAVRLSEYNDLMQSIQQEVNDCKFSTISMMKDFSVSRKAMAADLRQYLGDEEKARLENEERRIEEYENYMKRINDEVQGIFTYTNDLLDKFIVDRQEMSAGLKAELDANRKERIENTQSLLKSLQLRLAEISEDNQKSANQLRKDIDSGEAQRMQNYNDLITKITNEVNEIKSSTNGLLGDYAADRKAGADSWKKMQQEIANLREGAVDSVDSIKEIPAPVVIVEPAVEKIENAVVFQEEVVANEDIDAFVKKEPATLEEKILEYINNNPEGIRVSDMEQPLHETRMKIGYASKCLLDAGKVIKIDNLYYPINK
ncbi:MAG: hypothetical protein WCK85_09560 [Chlorobium sp.]